MARLRGIEPPHAAPEAAALSIELQAQKCFCPSPQPSPPKGRGVEGRTNPSPLSSPPEGRGVELWGEEIEFSILVKVEGEEDLASGGEATEVLIAQI